MAPSKEDDKLQFMLGEIVATQKLILEELKDQKQRVSAIERKVQYYTGGLAALIFIANYALRFLGAQ